MWGNIGIGRNVVQWFEAAIVDEQVWVHLPYTRYRRAYQKAFPLEDISGKILSHAMNRRVALLKGFQYTSLTPTSRGANSSSAFSEGWAVEFHSSPEQMAANKRRGLSFQYADLTDLMLLLDMKLGGGVMDAVNVAQKLVEPRPSLILSRPSTQRE